MTRQTRWWTWSGLAALAVAVVLLLGGPDALAQKRGGVLRIANLGEPPTLDAHWTTATLTEVLTNHLYEGLYALDEGYRPIPMLAEALPAVSPDGLTYTIQLRQGIKFHNGKEMTSDDVVASLKRWMQQGAVRAGARRRAWPSAGRRASTPSSSSSSRSTRRSR